MQEIVSKIIKELKGLKIPASKVESDLGFSNGQLGQAAKGKSKLSEERLTKLQEYHKSKTAPIAPKTVIKDLTKPTDVKPVTEPPPKSNFTVNTTGKKAAYNPFDNPVFKNKMGGKSKTGNDATDNS
jgi:hypothetical protein